MKKYFQSFRNIILIRKKKQLRNKITKNNISPFFFDVEDCKPITSMNIAIISFGNIFTLFKRIDQILKY